MKKDEDIVHDTSNGTKRSDEDADSGDHARAKKKIKSKVLKYEGDGQFVKRHAY